MIVKLPILPKRVRKVPKSFSWIDHRLVSDKHIDRCDHAAAALYLFLACVSDEEGLSYYGDKSIMNKLSMDLTTLYDARSTLMQTGLIAWQKPLYQVLDLEPELKIRQAGSVMVLGEILKRATEVMP